MDQFDYGAPSNLKGVDQSHIHKTQDPKYDVAVGLDWSDDREHYKREARIVTSESGKPIPFDEPIFILRAQDRYAIDALNQYYVSCHAGGCGPKHVDSITRAGMEFQKFAAENRERIARPD